MKLYVDDIRNTPDESWNLAKTVSEAIRAIARFDFDEISLDHDISHQVTVGTRSTPFPCNECFCAVAYFIGAKYKDLSEFVPKVTIHTANTVGAGKIEEILKRYKIDYDVKLMGQVNRLEMEVK